MRIENPLDLIEKYFNVSDKTIIDIGCGTGDLVRYLAQKDCKQIIGIDVRDMLKKALAFNPIASEKYIEGYAEKIPIENNYADCIIYFTSFHHIEPSNIPEAIKECKRVLKDKGLVIFVEPVWVADSWSDLSRIFHDEQDLLANAYNQIKTLPLNGFNEIVEENFYTERKYSDFENRMKIFIDDDDERKRVLNEAVLLLNSKYPEGYQNVIIKSHIRVNVFQKT